MNHLPVLKIEIEAVRTQVSTLLTDRNNEINEHIVKSLKNQLSEDWVIAEIDAAVKRCLKQAIEDISNNYQMRNAITDLVAGIIAKKLSDNAI